MKNASKIFLNQTNSSQKLKVSTQYWESSYHTQNI